MEHEPYLEEEHKDQLCKEDCKRIAGSLLFYYILLFACAFTLGIISSAYIMSGASQTELETITNIFSMIATCFVTILTLVIYKKKLHVTCLLYTSIQYFHLSSYHKSKTYINL